ncbi:uncharacterized protein LOC124496700 [Dermatophagoides farinae]|uniref:uncharacterized protein LOC124496700 n=1 Tax=Dermatophagoides farinae TaxID=6954 RepID=UPI003F6113E3
MKTNQKKEISPNWKILRYQEMLRKNQNNINVGGGKRKITKKTIVNGVKTNTTVDTKVNDITNGNHSVKKILNKFGLQENENKIWFDGVDPHLIRATQFPSNSNLCLEKSSKELTNAVAIDCEMVGTGYGGSNSALARVSMVNLYGHCIYDKYVKPIEKVTDYRTMVSGIRPEHLKNAIDFKTVQNEVSKIIDNRILVGHAVHHDLSVLYLSHPKQMIRDTSVYFKRYYCGRTPSLKRLAQVHLNVTIQDGEHDSIIDAQATMRLYTLFKKEWESRLTSNSKRKKKKKMIKESKSEI